MVDDDNKQAANRSILLSSSFESYRTIAETYGAIGISGATSSRMTSTSASRLRICGDYQLLFAGLSSDVLTEDLWGLSGRYH